MSPAELVALRRAYGEICRGYSETKYGGNVVYVAHLTSFDQTEIDILQEEAANTAIKRGIPTEADRLKWLDKKGIWTIKDERSLDTQKRYVDNLRTTKSKLFIKADIERMDKQLKEETLKWENMFYRRAKGIGLTAEQVAERRVQMEYIKLSFCRDRDLNLPLFTDKEMKELDEEDSESLLFTYIEVSGRLNINAIRRIALQPFFTNQFYLSENLYDFFGIPLVDLTIYQSNLLSYGQYYRNILTHHKVPKEFLEDPDKVEEYVNRSSNAKKVMSKVGAEGGRTGIVGGSAEDMQMMGVEDGTKTMQDIASKGYKDARSAAPDVGYSVITK